MPDSSYIIRIGSTADTSGWEKQEAAIRRSEQAARGFVDSIKMGVGIDIGGRLVTGVTALPGKFAELVREGIAFNVEMADGESAIAKIIGRFQGLNAEASKREAAKAIAQIVELEPKTAGTLSSLVQGFSATAASALSVGMTVRENIDLVAKFANVAANIKLPQEQLPQELRSILSGNITSDSAIAKTLQISNDDIKTAKELGTLYQFLAEKIGSLGVAGDTFETRLSSLESTIKKTLGEATKSVFEELKTSLVELNTALQTPETQAALKALGIQLADVVGDGVKLTEWALKNGAVLLTVAKSAGILVAAYAAMKIKDIVVGFAGMTASFIRNTAAIEAETAALGRHTAAQAADNAAGRGNARGSMLGRIGNAAGVGLGIAAVGYTAASAYADSISAASAQSRGIGNQISEISNKYAELARGATTAEQKAEAIAGLEEDIAALKKLSAEASEEDADLIDRGIALLERQLGITKSITAARLAKNAAEASGQKRNEVAENSKQISEIFEKGGEKLAKRVASAALAEAVGKGDVGAVDRAIEAKQVEIDKAGTVTATSSNLAEVTQAAEEVNKLQEEMQDLKDLRVAAAKQDAEDVKAREKENNEAAIKALQDELALLEAIHEQHLANIDASGGTEADRAAKRRDEEADFATVKLHQADKIGLLQGESADAKEARHIDAATGDIERDTAAKAAQKIDPKTTTKKQKHIGTDGIEIGEGSKDDHLYKTGSRLGANIGSVPLRPPSETAAELAAARRASLSPASLLPPVARPAAQEQGSNRNSAAAKSADEAGDKVKTAIDKFTDGVTKKLAGLEPKIDAAGTAVAGALDRIDRKIDNLKGQIQNTGTS